MSKDHKASKKPSEAAAYDVGYGKPPKHHQWRPGQSGKPTGRPPEAKSFEAEVKRLLRRKVPIKVNGQSRKITVLQANFERLLHKAMGGDTKAMLMILELGRQYLPEDMKGFEELREEDREILKRFLDRKGSGSEGGDDGES